MISQLLVYLVSIGTNKNALFKIRVVFKNLCKINAKLIGIMYQPEKSVSSCKHIPV